MSRLSSPREAGGLLLLASSALCAGCLSLAPEAGDLVRSERGAEPVRVELGPGDLQPAILSDVHRSLPGLIQTIYAHGVVWIGYNAGTAEGGTLRAYGVAEGTSFGIAFGNGEDLKRFFEVGYEDTGWHKAYDGAGAEISEATHERFYLGLRRYLLPPAAESRARIAPFLVGGVTYQVIDGNDGVATSQGFVAEAEGVGLYLGTGLEFYIGTSSQFALALDVRGSVVSFDGYPEGTGTQASVGGALSLVYHF